ncbi:MAG: protein kinase [Polyangiaceae bacterium]
MEEATAAKPSPGVADDDSKSSYLPGHIVARKFTLVRRIGGGGTGVVYEARDQLVDRRVAIKLLHQRHANHPDVVRRFLREAQATASVRHPNIVTVHEMGRRRGGSYYIVQELLEGESLRDFISRNVPIPAADVVDLVLPLTSALAAAHHRGIVHRDVKPENVILEESDAGIVPKLIDFGIAKVPKKRQRGHATLMGVQLGTPAYMAPEQVRGDESIDGRADVWAIGVVLVEMLTGRSPFEAPSEAATYVNILRHDPADLRLYGNLVPEALVSICLRALEPNASKRWPTMNELRVALANLRSTLGASSMGTLIRDAHERREDGLSRNHRLADTPLHFAGDKPRPEDEPEHWIDLDDVESQESDAFELTPASGEAARPPLESVATDELEAAAAVATEESSELAAKQALEVNALDHAITLAAEVLDQSPHPKSRAHMHLVQAVAHLWLGHFVECDRSARAAMRYFEPSTTGWFVALGHAATACGTLGRREALLELATELCERTSAEDAARDRAAHDPTASGRAIAASRLAVALLRAGERSRADEVIKRARGRRYEPLVRAWIEVYRAELAIHGGDASSYLRHIEAALEHFTLEQDVRNECLQRHNVANACMQLGAYARAERLLREVLDVAEPMQLSLVAGAKVNLGLVLGRLGKLDEAVAVEAEALELCVEQGNKRFESVGLVYMSLIRAMRQELGEAEAAAELAREAAADTPPLLAIAQAALGGVLLMQGRAADALPVAEQALALSDKLGGVEEGEALIRLVHMTSLGALGRDTEARTAIAKARQRLLDRAARIDDTAWRRSFLDNVPEHARTLDLASRWIDEGRSTASSIADLRRTVLGPTGPEPASPEDT